MQRETDPVRTYLKNRILNASPMELIIILYEGAITSLKKAKQLAAAKDRPGMCEQVIRAQDMVRELRDSLDMSRGQIADGLFRLYGFMLQRLIKANLEKEAKYIDEVLLMLTDLKNTWLQAVSNLKEKPKMESPESYVNIIK